MSRGRDQVADAAQLGVPVGVGGLILEDHLAAFEHGAFGDQHHRILARVVVAVIHQQLGQAVDVEFVFRDHAAVGCAGHGGQHGGEAGIAPKHLQHQEALVRAGDGAQAVGQLDGAGDAGAEADAVIGAGHIVIHRLGDGDDLDALLVQAHAVAQRIIAADGDQVIDAQEIQVLEHLGGQIVVVFVDSCPSDARAHRSSSRGWGGCARCAGRCRRCARPG